MRKCLVALVAWVALAALGCAPPPDLDAERSALLAADAEAKEAAVRKDIEAWVSLLTDDAVWLPPNAPILTGKDAIRSYIEKQFAVPGFAVRFPGLSEAALSQAGDLGYTYGTFELTVNDAEGNPITTKGKYLAIRKKQPDGTWKEVLSISNFERPQPSPASE